MPPLLQGFITVAKPLDFERTKRYNVRVMAQDKGEERQSSVVEVIWMEVLTAPFTCSLQSVKGKGRLFM